jgi:hypothetical protein
MGNKQELIYSFRAALRIIETTLYGNVPFKIVEIYEDSKQGPYAEIDIEGTRFMVAPDVTGNKIWILNFPVENTSETGLDSGYAGFPSDVAGAIQRYYNEKPKGPFQHLTGIGTINLNEIVKEEVERVFKNPEASIEAEISSALGFIQDAKGSIDSLSNQKNLSVTDSGVDRHLSEAINQIDKAISSYFKNLSPEVKSKVLSRIGEIKI